MRFASLRVGFALALLGLVALAVFPGCRRAPAAAAGAPTTPTLRLYVVSTTAGALEPCGCTKDMLGGVDHAAAFIAKDAKDAKESLIVGAGPLLFMNPKAEEARAVQDLWKAEALAAAFADLGLTAWAPGANDWAAGEAELRRLSGLARADVLAANLRGSSAGAKATRIVEAGGHRIGLAGVSEPKGPFGGPPGVEIDDPLPALEGALAELRRQKAEVFVALVAADRGRALRLAEQVHGFHVLVVGKPYDQGEGNDPAIPPTLVDDTLVVQAPNHLQGIVVLDLFVRGSLPFKDGTGIAALERRQSLESRAAELERRIREWEAGNTAKKEDVAARKKDLEALRSELAKLEKPAPPSEGSFFQYRVEEVRERLGSSKTVGDRIGEYYRRVNEHNKEAFKDRVPPPVRAGESKYIGAEACGNCHDKAYEFWTKTPHAAAYTSLSKQHKEFNLDCVSCHVTGYEKPGGTTVTHVEGLQAVQCEVCHGPGSRHEDDPADTSALVRSPPKTLCAPACHHPPHVPADWNVDRAWEVILGKGHGMK